MLGLFDRPADEKAICALLKSPAIPGLTESLTDLSPSEWRTILARLRRARLLAAEKIRTILDIWTHIRSFVNTSANSFGVNELRRGRNAIGGSIIIIERLLPICRDSFREMEPLFLAVICGCNAGLFREALHEVYIPRIQRGNAYFAANVLGARGALLSVLAHFFEHGRWGSLVETDVEGQSLTAEDQLFILMQAGQYLTATRGLGSTRGTNLLRARRVLVSLA